MRAVAADAFLAGVVLAAWLGCAGFARLRSPLDRLHCVTFVNATCGAALAALAFTADGLSDRALKTLLFVAVALLSGTAVAHATGRALLLRGSAATAHAEDE